MCSMGFSLFFSCVTSRSCCCCCFLRCYRYQSDWSVAESVAYFDFRRNSHFVISLRLLLLVLRCSRLVGVRIFNFIFQSELNCFSLVRRANNINMRGREEEKVSMTNNNARMFNRIVKMLVSFSNSFTCEPRFDVEFESMQSFYASIKVFAVCIKF